MRDLPGDPVVQNLPVNAGDMSSTSGLEDPTCLTATKSVRHSYWAQALESPWATITKARAPQLGKAHMQQWKPNAAKNKCMFKTWCNI